MAALLPIAVTVAEGVYDLVTFGFSLSGIGAASLADTAAFVSTKLNL